VDDFLPIWAQPHRFALLDERQRPVFTFGLVLTELRSLAYADGVRSFGRRFGYEWLPGLSEGVHRELKRVTPEDDLATFLSERHGMSGPGVLTLSGWKGWDGEAGEPTDEIVGSFAEAHGMPIRRWSGRALALLDASVAGWALARERVPDRYGVAARRRLQATKMQHALRLVDGGDGHQHWARGYETLYERVALELEDLALQRPKPRICTLCKRVFIPLRPNQSICSGQVWDALSGTLLRHCTPPTATAHSAVEAADYRKRRKTRWAAMRRARARYGDDDPRTAEAVNEWESWREQNPPLRPPGRPRKLARQGDEAPFRPTD
jgi:hypothetical protein